MSKELLATMDAEHESMAALLAETRTAIGALTQTAGFEESKAAPSQAGHGGAEGDG